MLEAIVSLDAAKVILKISNQVDETTMNDVRTRLDSDENSNSNDRPKAFIIVLNWNGLRDTMACLESLRAVRYQNFHVIIVDNGSKGDDANILKEEYGDFATVIRNDENKGFAEGNNVGIRRALQQSADYILLLNNDAIVDPDFLDALIVEAESRPDVAILGPMIYYYPPHGSGDGEIIWSAGGKFTRRIAQPFHIGLGEADRGQFDGPRKVDYISGCALLIKREVVERIGLLDESYFAYFEDLDWNLKALKAGYSVLLVPRARIWHKTSSSSVYMSPTYIYLNTRNRILFAKKHLSALDLFAFFLPFFMAMRFVRILSMTVTQGRDGVRAIIAGVLDGAYNRSGPPGNRKF